MTILAPPELGTIGEGEDDLARIGAVADHVHAVLRHRTLSPAEQVLICVQVSVAIVTHLVPEPARALGFLASLTGRSMSIARQIKQQQDLADATPAGSA